ncbi:MAG: hypothetical protein R3A51_13485 [Nannocystaceae bacterium]|nr:hypothetical protein [Myxococcales bacterium]
MTEADGSGRGTGPKTLLELTEEVERREAARRHESLLLEIADDLERDGFSDAEVLELRELSVEIEALERPPSLLSRLSGKAREVARAQWTLLVGELEESREAMGLIKARMRGERTLSAEERDKIRSQMMDLVKVFPAGLIAAANSAFPIPGTGLFTPWILNRLGLMPSRWREAHLLDCLRKRQEALRASGRIEAAEKLEEIREAIEHEAAEREAVRSECRLLTHWDANQNGEWDDDEREAYAREVARLRGLLPRFATRKRWFLEHEGEVFGAVRLGEIDVAAAAGVLICFDGKSGWVALSDLLAP